MRNFVVKVLALENSLYIAWNAASNAAGGTAGDAAGDAAWSAAWYAAWSAAEGAAWSAAEGAARIAVRDAAKSGKSVEDIADVACLSVMNNYDKILEAIDKLDSVIEPKKGMNPIDVARRLITFNDDQMKKLVLMNKRFRLFYFFRVHEIISLINDDQDDDVERSLLLNEFNELLKKIGDLATYNQLFVSDIKLESLDGLSTIINIPRDMIKIMISYCHLSIHNTYDLNDIFDKIISL